MATRIDPAGQRSRGQWAPPADLDAECVELCKALNRLPGIQTTCSCCGHGARPYRIFFAAARLEALPDLLYWFDGCHSGYNEWDVLVQTDCARSPASFMIEGPVGGFHEAAEIARMINEDIDRARTATARQVKARGRRSKR